MICEAVCNFWGKENLEQDAALAWAFELTYYFKRGVGEAPLVTATPSWHVHPKGWPADRVTDYVHGLRLNFWKDEEAGKQLVIYTVRGLTSTTHPYDKQPVTYFDRGSAWSLEDSMRPDRRQRLRGLYARSDVRWDGR